MFNYVVNMACNNAKPVAATIYAMPKTPADDANLHESMRRLYPVARTHGDAKKSAVARTLNISQQRLKNWEARGISREGALAAQATYGISATWLLSGDAPQSLSNAGGDRESHEQARILKAEKNSSYAVISLLDGYAGMGRGDYISDYPEVVESLRISKDWIAQKLPGVPPEYIRVITGRGDSMKGRFNDGDLIFLDTRVKAFDQDSAYCFRWSGRVQIKRLQFIGNNRVRVLSENPVYPPLDVDLAELEIGGRAMAAWTLTDF